MLSRNQENILKFLHECSRNRIPPTVREICAATGIGSTSTVFSALRRLEQMGYIELGSGASRAIRLKGTAGHVDVPLLGNVTAGIPILAQESIEEYLPFPAALIKEREVFALRVRGMSMKDAGILDGDIICAEATRQAQRGDIVVALIGDEATVKRFFPEDGYIRLQPENPQFEPIIEREVTVLGKVISVLRVY